MQKAWKTSLSIGTVVVLIAISLLIAHAESWRGYPHINGPLQSNASTLFIQDCQNHSLYKVNNFKHQETISKKEFQEKYQQAQNYALQHISKSKNGKDILSSSYDQVVKNKGTITITDYDSAYAIQFIYVTKSQHHTIAIDSYGHITHKIK